MAKDINFNIKLQIDGKEQIAVPSTDTKEFAKQLGYVKREVLRALLDYCIFTLVGAGGPAPFTVSSSHSYLIFEYISLYSPFFNTS